MAIKIVSDIDSIQREVCRELNLSHRIELGQYMTPFSISSFMASLFNLNKAVRLLDAGAGIGSLSAAFLERALQKGAAVDVTAWEVDPVLCDLLKVSFNRYIKNGQGLISARINFSDFVEDASNILQECNCNLFTHAILNPPYKKINAASKHRALLRKVGIETVNLYSAFVALAILLLDHGGELVAIIPRSFCNGPYYKPFRELLLKNCAILQIHLFESRNKAFRDDDVLQENVIIHLVKGKVQGNVIVSTSYDAQFKDYQQNTLDSTAIIKPNDVEKFIHIPTTEKYVELPSKCLYTLQEIGLNVCTGPVVDFRMKEFWLNDPTEVSAPLLYAHHFSDGQLVWPRQHKKPNALQITPEVSKCLMQRGHYVLVKRFSAKEELRRVVAYHLSPEEINFPYIGFENHWNVFHMWKRGMDKATAKGLMIFLNSSIVDNYFRVFSGHTQVNATDLRSLRYPSRELLRELGTCGNECGKDQGSIDRLVERFL